MISFIAAPTVWRCCQAFITWHLLALTVDYFESRQSGRTVARVREQENIRDFITGSALTVMMLDRRPSIAMLGATDR